MPRGSQPGERRGGRKKGTPNKATAEVKALARSYGPKAIEKLARLAGLLAEGEGAAASEQAQVSAITQLLDRGYGKPAQVVEGSDDGPPIKTVLEVAWLGSALNASKS